MLEPLQSTGVVDPSLVKLAPTVLAAVIVTRHSWVRLTGSRPVQTPGSEPAAGVPFRVPAVPSVNSAEHSVPQLMPDGVLTTVPEPLPALVTLRVNLGVAALAKLAVTALAAV